jgi:pimeloyl-ACP methyl ester carboxylesterase
MSGVIFVSCRRSDAEGKAGRLCDDLVRWFGACVIFAGASCAWAAGGAGTPCGDLAKLQIENATISEAVSVPDGTPLLLKNRPAVTSLPAHCLVHGEVNHHQGSDGRDYGDKFELRMPARWEGRLLYMGGGGLDGVLSPAIALQGPGVTPTSPSALSRGYAVVSSDGGHHDEPGVTADGSFGSDPGARADYNDRSTQRVTDVARVIIARFYGGPIRHAYFQGCSNGGREGLMAAERYPDYFDGVIAGAPAFNLTHAAMAEAWNTMQLASIAPRRADGTPDLPQSLTQTDLKLLVGAVLDKCDALDGLKDGLIFNPEACHFDPAVLTCRKGQSSGCLPEEKVKVIDAIFQGPRNAKGKALYSTWPYDSGDGADGWRAWMTGVGSVPSINVSIFPAFYNGLAVAGAPPRIDIFTFDFDRDAGRIEKASSEMNANATDWSAFRKRKGKLLLYTGMSDPVFSGNDLIRYYNAIEQNNGGETETHSFARLFLVPGMTHCGSGPALDDFDTLAAMQSWVEEGKAPDSIVSTGQAFPGRSRPLCPYPKITTYTGVGNRESAASFRCLKP